ncbi:membrane protein [Synergistales bacterium]|nr:membrane protein [Synergistales bacterium]
MLKSPIFLCFCGAFTSAVLFCAGAVVPFIGVAALLFCPVPLAILGARENDFLATAGLAMASLILLPIFGVWVSLYFFLGEGVLCLGLTVPLGRVKNGVECLFLCVVVSILSKLLLLALMMSLRGQNPFMMDPESMKVLLSQMTLSFGGNAEEAIQVASHMAKLASWMLPSLILFSSVFDSFFNYKLCEVLQRRFHLRRKFPPITPFDSWRFPRSLLWAFVFAFMLPLFMEEDDALGGMMEVNLKFSVCAFYFFQGLSLVWWALLRKKWPRFLRVMLMVLLCVPVLGLWVIGLGVGDMCFDIRARVMNKNK